MSDYDFDIAEVGDVVEYRDSEEEGVRGTITEIERDACWPFGEKRFDFRYEITMDGDMGHEFCIYFNEEHIGELEYELTLVDFQSEQLSSSSRNR